MLKEKKETRKKSKRRAPRTDDTWDFSRFQESTHPTRPIVSYIERVDERITDCEFCTTENFTCEVTTSAESNAPVVACRTDEDLRARLKNLLGLPHIDVQVAGGIVRHGLR